MPITETSIDGPVNSPQCWASPQGITAQPWQAQYAIPVYALGTSYRLSESPASQTKHPICVLGKVCSHFCLSRTFKGDISPFRFILFQAAPASFPNTPDAPNCPDTTESSLFPSAW